MKLVKLYSNDSRFKEVKFGRGFNVILGRIYDEAILDKDSHNLGKSSLIELIDFMLLKQIKSNSYLKRNQFINHVFFLEIELDNGKYLTIKRAVKTNTKISFKITDIENNCLVNETEWDYTDLPLSSKDPDKNPKNILDKILDFNVLKKYSFRNYLNYFLRTQKDYGDEFHLSKFAGGDADWKPLLFNILGFESLNVEKKYELDKEYENKSSYVEKLKNSLQININEIDKIKGLIQIKEMEKLKIEESLSKFDFYINEKKIDKELVYEIEDEISKLNSRRYRLEMEIKDLEESIENEVTFDLKSTLKIFKEVNIYFSEQLTKSYEELIEFNKAITTDRNKYVLESLENKKEELDNTQERLRDLNTKREEMLEILTETDTFKKYKNFEIALINIEKDLERYKNKISEYVIIEDEISQLNNIKSNIEELKKKIRNQIDEQNQLYLEIRKSFSKYVEMIIDKPGLLSIGENRNGNVEFKSEIYNAENELTAEGDGYSYKNILCACFDLAIITNYSDKSFIKFIYHDGCLETLDPRKQKNYLDLIQNLCDKYNIQYILTLIESDLPVLEGKKYELSQRCNVAVELSDKDETSSLFGFKF